MRIVKWLKNFLLVGMFILFLSYQNSFGVSNISNSDMLGECDQVSTGEVFLDSYDTLWYNFKNKWDKTVYIHRFKTAMDPGGMLELNYGNVEKYENSDQNNLENDWSDLIVLNRPYLSPRDYAVHPGEKVRVLTSPEEHGNGVYTGVDGNRAFYKTSFNKAWQFDNAKWVQDGWKPTDKEFNKANIYVSDYPDQKTTGDGYDAQFRVGIIYDNDNNIETNSDNSFRLSCINLQVRWNDQDNDDIPDSRDACPKVPENYNDVEDQDGCPELPSQTDQKTQIAVGECNTCPCQIAVFDGLWKWDKVRSVLYGKDGEYRYDVLSDIKTIK